MKYEFGLRERKKAQLRIDVINITIEMMKSKSFEDIKIQEICEAVSISNVTFFKYFNKKETILEYFEAVWSYKRWTEQQEEVVPVGKAAMLRLFEDLSGTENGQEIVNTIERYITKSSYNRLAVRLTDCEKWLIYPEMIYNEIPSIGDQLSLAFDQAVELKEISNDIGKLELLVLLTTVYYGTPVVTHLEDKSLKGTYKLVLDFIFRMIETNET